MKSLFRNLTPSFYFISFLCLIGFLMRVYNLSWGAPFFFHPDERNIASAISQMQFPTQLNPHFFAYGALPLYTVFFVGLLQNFFTVCGFSFQGCSVSFDQAIMISRSFSVIFSTLLIPLLFVIGKTFYDNKIGILASVLSCFSVGLIQFAHFGTVEMWLTFFGGLLFYTLIKFLKTEKIHYLVLSSFSLGILTATKLSSIVLIPFTLFLTFLFLFLKKHSPLQKRLKLSGISLITFVIIPTIIFTLSNPFVFLDTKSFLGSMQYEIGVARGIVPVFYTGEFVHTVPVLYHFIHVYPFLINPFLTVLFVFSFFYLVVMCFKKKSFEYAFLLLFFLFIFSSQAFVFVKWVRYMVPTVPYIYLITAFFIISITKKLQAFLQVSIYSVVFLVILIFSLSYVKTAFYNADTRIEASLWAKDHILCTDPILSEMYDLGIVPFNTHFQTITLFNFYDLDLNSLEYNDTTLKEAINNNTYIVLPSARILKNRIQKPETFPNGYAFYNKLKNQKEFKKIYETPCDVFCRIIYLGNPVYNFEQTSHVFDRPTIIIYKKI